MRNDDDGQELILHQSFSLIITIKKIMSSYLYFYTAQSVQTLALIQSTIS